MEVPTQVTNWPCRSSWFYLLELSPSSKNSPSNMLLGETKIKKKTADTPFPPSLAFREALRIGSELYHTLKGVIQEKYGQDATNVGDEGGFAPNILENSEGKEEKEETVLSTKTQNLHQNSRRRTTLYHTLAKVEQAKEVNDEQASGSCYS